MYCRSSGPNRSSWKRRCPTTGKLRRIACLRWIEVVGGDRAERRGPQRLRPGTTSCLVCNPRRRAQCRGTRIGSAHGPDPEARPGRLGGGQRGAQAALRRAGRPAPDAAHPDRRGRAARGLPLPSGGRGPRAGRPGAAGDAAGRAGDLLRPAPRLLAGRALRDGRPPDVPRRVRRGVVPQPRAGHGALGRRGAAGRPSRRCPRTPAGGRCTWSAGASAGSSAC